MKDIGQKTEGEWHKKKFQIWIFTKIFKITEFVSGKTPNKNTESMLSTCQHQPKNDANYIYIFIRFTTYVKEK